MKLKTSIIALSVSLVSTGTIAAPTLITPALSVEKTPIIQQAPIDSNSWIEVDLSVFENNIKHMQEYVGKDTKICAIMKADAYGNGIANLIPSVIKSRIPCIGFASNQEAKIARYEGFKGQLMRVRAATPSEIEGAVKFKVEELVGSLTQAEIVDKIAQKHKTTINAHLAMNSAGMGRNGIDMSSEAGRQDAVRIVKMDNMKITGMMTHFPTEDLDKTRQGLKTFKEQTGWLIKKAALKREDITLHVANSFTALMIPESHLDMIRPGGAFYGDTTPKFSEYKQIFSFKTRVASVHNFPKGSTVGYDSTIALNRNSKLANLPVGYSDGFPRSLSNKGYVLIHGQKAKIMGKTSMNTTMVDITDIKSVEPGDEVVLYGKQGDNEITITEMQNKTGRALSDLYTLWGAANPKYYKHS